MKVKYSISGSTLNLLFFGELDECSAVKTRDIIDEIIEKSNTAKQVVFNLSGLSFMDSTGIGMLIGRYKKCKSKGMVCYIQNPSVSIEKIIEISGLYKIMPKI